jgi:intracellular sulfur oxidation DsrE/DsrF family protein
MTDDSFISRESLNAFLDGELAADERNQLLTRLQHDKVLAQELCELRQTKELLALAYHQPPLPAAQTRTATASPPSRIRHAIAAGLLLGIGLSLGWVAHHHLADNLPPSLQNITQLDPATAVNNKILLHISSMDSSRVKAVLDTTEKLLNNPRSENTPLQLEIVANADGLGLLRAGSPYAERIHNIARQHRNVSFKACGFAMETVRLKEGNEVLLLPDAQRVDAALEQILRRLKDGWLYVRA